MPSDYASKLSSKKKLRIYRSALATHPLDDPFWLPRSCFRSATSAVWETAASFELAAKALLEGRHSEAIRQLEKAERADVLAWGLPTMSVTNPEIIRWRPIDEIKLPERGRVDSGYVRPTLLDAMYRRDGWRCRFCGCPVIVPKARDKIVRLLPGAFRWTNSNGDHAGFTILSGVADHVQPHAWGGPSNLDNLVTCCAPCNYGRGSAFLEEVGLIDPRTREPYPANGWDGLTRVLAIPTTIKISQPLQSPKPNMVAWAEFVNLLKDPISG